MKPNTTTRRRGASILIVLAVLSALVVGAAGGAYAASISGFWGFAGQTHVSGFDTPFVTGSTTFVQVTNTYIPQNGWKAGDKLVVRVNAESSCTGGTGWCSLRVMYRNGSGAYQELLPAVGTDFAFANSSGATAQYAGNSMTRVLSLPSVSGSSGVWLEAAVRPTGGTAVTFGLDDLVMTADILCNARSCS